MTIVNHTAMIFFCIFMFAVIPWLIVALIALSGKKVDTDITGITILFALAGWAFGFAFFSTP